MAQPQIKTELITLNEYLELEKTSEIKHEFYYGEIYSMAGTTRVHNEIVFNTTSLFKKGVKNNKKKCFVYLEAVKVEITKKQHYAYPDVVVSCSEKEDDPLSIKHPILIVEVLSDSTREYDMNKKFEFYKQIPSLKHYLLIEQNQCFINSYTKQNDFWYHESYSKKEDLVELLHLDIKISVKEIYDNVQFK